MAVVNAFERNIGPVSQEMLSLGNSVAATRYPRILCRLDK